MTTKVCSLFVGVLSLGALAGSAAAQDPMAPPPPTTPAYSAPVRAADGGQKEKGFAFEVHLGSTLISLGGGGGGAITLGALEGGFFAGYKLDRLIFGVGFDIERVASGRSATMQMDTSQAQTAILFVPGVRFAILRSDDRRVELYAQFDIGFGTSFTSQNPAPMGPQPDTSNYRITYDIGPGLRYWAAPQFALGTFVGVNGDFTSSSTSNPAGMGTVVTVTNSTGVTGIMAALQALAVF